MTDAARPRVALMRPPLDTAPVFTKQVENLGLAYLAADLRRCGSEVEILDGMLMGWDEDRSVAEILDRKPDVVGLTVVNNYFPDSTGRICRSLRDAGFGGRIVIGGHSASFIPEQILNGNPSVDAVFVGEGEKAFGEFVTVRDRPDHWADVPNLAFRDRARPDGVVRNRVRRISDLDALAHPARDMTRAVMDRDGLVAMSTSRGCQARCTFCSVPRFFGLSKGANRPSGWLGRSAPSVGDEAEALVRTFGVREILIVDDEFFGGGGIGLARGTEIASELKRRRLPIDFAVSCRAESVDERVLEALSEAGLRHVFIGVEFGNARDAKLYGKNATLEENRRAVRVVKELGLSLGCGFIMFNHDTDLESIALNLEFLADIGELKPLVLATSLGPHHGTPLATLLERQKRLRAVASGFDFELRDHRALAMRALAERVAEAFIPYAQSLVAVRSGITFEWRRSLPGRSVESERSLDEVERRISDRFSAIVVAGLDSLWSLDPAEPLCVRSFVTDYEGAIAAAARDADLALALAGLRIRAEEGAVRYHSQNDHLRELELAVPQAETVGGTS